MMSSFDWEGYYGWLAAPEELVGRKNLGITTGMSRVDEKMERDAGTSVFSAVTLELTAKVSSEANYNLIS